jgi:DnaK suppressor protein
MDNGKLDYFRQRLIRRREELQTLSKTGAQDAKPVELDQQRVGRLSRMDAMQVQAMSSETERRRGIELSRIESALERIDSGDFGYCVKCDEDISEKRMEIDPSAPLCVECANKAEKRG